MTETGRRYMGNSVPRKEDTALLTGRATFTDDIRLPGMLHLAVLRSPHAHARITAIDTSAARELPGVVEAVSGDDCGGRPARPDAPGLSSEAPYRATAFLEHSKKAAADVPAGAGEEYCSGHDRSGYSPGGSRTWSIT